MRIPIGWTSHRSVLSEAAAAEAAGGRGTTGEPGEELGVRAGGNQQLLRLAALVRALHLHPTHNPVLKGPSCAAGRSAFETRLVHQLSPLQRKQLDSTRAISLQRRSRGVVVQDSPHFAA